MTLPVPDTIGRFKIEARLGTGGMGDVYRAEDPTLRRTVAIKTVRPDIDNPMYLDRLYREAQAIARLQHPYIVTVFEAGETGGLVYIAMEFLKGENLAAALDRGDLTFEAKIKALVQILDALQYAHSEGVIHRDIKPANVHRLPDGSIKLLDFGLARVTRAESLTQTGAVMGTPFYASPEQLSGEPVDNRTDIYSCGVLAYEMFTGRRAFDGDNLSTVILKVLSTPPPPMQTSWSITFPEIERIVLRAMAKSAGDRYATAEDMRNALAAFLASSREGLASLQAEQTIVSQRTVREASTLISSGDIAHARELLTDTLRLHPEATAVRSLLKETSAAVSSQPTLVRPSPDAAPLPATRVSPPVAARIAAPMSPAASGASAATATIALPNQVGATTTDAPTAAPPRASNTMPLAWAAAAIVVALGGGWMLWSGRGAAPPTPPERSTAAVESTTPAASSAAPSSPAPAADAPAGSAAAAPPVSTPASTVAAPPEVGKPPATATATNAPASAPAAATNAAASPRAAPPASAAAPSSDASAKKLFAENASRNPGLRYGIVQLRADNTEAEVDPDTTFHSGDRVRFSFEPNIDGYMYVVQEGSTGKWNMLFPNPQINGGTNAVQHGQRVAIPREGWFKFDSSAGTERAFVFLSKEPLTSLPGFKEPVTKMESVDQSVVDDLKRTVKARDLVFEKDPGPPGGRRQSTFVVNRDELGKFVSATIQLVHQ